jgi:hypothetical protein
MLIGGRPLKEFLGIMYWLLQVCLAVGHSGRLATTDIFFSFKTFTAGAYASTAAQ